jgi:hypothetical protein
LFTLRQFFLISPFLPINGLIFPILIIEAAKFLKKSFWLLENLRTIGAVVIAAMGSDNITWSDGSGARPRRRLS